jgi:hypothetical protein
MNDFEAAGAVGDVVRYLHQFQLTPDGAALRLKPYLSDGACRGIIQARLDGAMLINQQLIRDASHRNDDLKTLSLLIASMGRASNPAEPPARPQPSAPVTTPTGHAAANKYGHLRTTKGRT